MCGIAGIAGQDEEVIRKMTAALEHRGPDGRAHWVGGGMSLGHARLAILDPRPEGDQPMWNDDKTVGIVYNGEIYNYRELRQRYGLDCATGTDTEVILRLYEKLGMSFVAELRGMFAFGICDLKQKTWHLARDHRGIKPLFVAYPKGTLAFASEMRALLRAFETKPAIDEQSLSLYLRLQYVPGPRTICQGIEQLPPGTILTWRDGKEERSSFKPEEATSFSSKADFRERFPNLMDDIVRQHLVSDKPVGLFLSGGMDSSILLHHMAGAMDSPVKTFTVRFEATKEEGAERFNNDANLALRSAKHYGTDHHDIQLTASQFLDLYRNTAKGIDQPNANGIAVAQALLAQEAKKKVDVVLSGIGGDEFFGGYQRYRIAQILKYLSPVPPPLRSLMGTITGQPSDVLRMQPGPRLAERILSRPADECRSIARGDWFDPGVLNRLFDAAFERLPQNDPVGSFMKFDRHLWLIDEALRLADGTTMMNGLECRVPFVDERIIAASHATPSSWHVTPWKTKTLLKETYRNLLPNHLYTLSKASFFSPFAKWLRREARPLAEAAIEHPRIQQYFDTKALRSVLEKHVNHERYGAYPLATIIQLAHWFDTVYDA